MKYLIDVCRRWWSIMKYPKSIPLVTIIMVFILLDYGMAKLYWKHLSSIPYYFAVNTRRDDMHFHHTLRENIDTVDRWGMSIYPLKTNSLGFRDSDVRVVQKTANKKRILFIGDSFTEGLGLPFEKTFVGIVSDRLRPNNIEVLNAGVMSYSPKLYHYKLKYLLDTAKVQMNTVVVMIDMSDMQDEIAYKEYAPGTQNLFRSLEQIIKRYAVRNSVIGNMVFRAAYTLSERYDKHAAIPGGKATGTQKDYASLEEYTYERSAWYSARNYDAWGREGSELAKYHLSELVKLCKTHGAEVVLAVYPWPRQIDENDAENRHVLYWREFARAHNVGFINLFALFMPSDPDTVIEQYYIHDDIHFNEAGHMLVAQSLLKWYSTHAR